MKKPWVTVMAVWLSAILLIVFLNTFFATTSASTQNHRTIVFEWYSFFDVPMIKEVWERREYIYGEDHVLSWEFPVVYTWEPSPKLTFHYSSARLRVTARNLPEIAIDKLGGRDTGFLPLFLMNSTPVAIPTGGVVYLKLRMQYIGENRAAQLGISKGLLEGWEGELSGTVVMDEAATMRILGITEADFAEIETWWENNEAAVEDSWENWLYEEGASGGRVDIRPFYDYPFERLFFNLTLSHTGENVTLAVNLVAWGIECLLARWFQETFMSGYEGWYSDLRLNATIRPTTGDIDVDTALDWALEMWSSESIPYADGVWVWEAQLADTPELAHHYKMPISPAYPYYQYENGTRKKYYTAAPGNLLYNNYTEYDYTPAAWNLDEGETLKFSFKDIEEKGGVWVLRQEAWDPITQTPTDTTKNVTGILELGYMEPWGNATEHHSENVDYDPAAKTLTLTGPLDTETWMLSNFHEDWEKLGGLLSWGSPYIEFRVVSTTVSVTPPVITGPPPDIGDQFKVNITVYSVFDIWSWQAGIAFDPAVLECISLEEGSFLASGGTTTWTAGSIDNNAGTISPCSSVLSAGVPVKGTGVLVEITFRVVAQDSTQINLTDVILFDSDLAELPVGAVHNGNVEIQGATGLLFTFILVGVIVVVALTVVVTSIVYVRKRRRQPREGSSHKVGS